MPDDNRTYRDVRPVRELISDEEAWEAKVFRDETDYKHGLLKAELDRASYLIGHAEAMGGKFSDAKSADLRKYDGRTTSFFLDYIERKYEIGKQFYPLDNKRISAELKLKLWQTTHADKRLRER